MSKTVCFSPLTTRCMERRMPFITTRIARGDYAGEVVGHIDIERLGLLAAAQALRRLLHPEFLGIDKRGALGDQFQLLERAPVRCAAVGLDERSRTSGSFW